MIWRRSLAHLAVVLVATAAGCALDASGTGEFSQGPGGNAGLGGTGGSGAAGAGGQAGFPEAGDDAAIDASADVSAEVADDAATDVSVDDAAAEVSADADGSADVSVDDSAADASGDDAATDVAVDDSAADVSVDADAAGDADSASDAPVDVTADVTTDVADGATDAPADVAQDATPDVGPLVEDCLDGVDNDGDLLIDCADPDCAPGFECVAEAPAGWTGYYRVRTDLWPIAASEACADGSAPSHYFEGPGQTAQCTGCTCGSLAGAACGAPPLRCWTSSNSCGGALGDQHDLTAELSDLACHHPTIADGVLAMSCKLLGSASQVSSGACPASSVGFPNTETWQRQDDVCGRAHPGGGGCASGDVCAPRASGSYAGQVCVQGAVGASCPAGWGVPLEAYTGATDTRACTSCTCSPLPVGCAGGSYTLHDLDTCSAGDATSVLSTTACVDVSGLIDGGTWSARATPAAAGAGFCAAGGGKAVGSVTTSGATTFCCR